MEEPLNSQHRLPLDANQPWHVSPPNLPTTSILILEDDDICRTMARNILRAADFDVICTRDYEQAFYTVEKGFKIDIALVDVNMPADSPDGICFARAAQVMCPWLKVIFMSARLSLRSFRLLDDDEIFLRKPFTPHLLIDMVSRAALQ
jgi:two-component system cell cycle sensor histidine kinase/response regulator CckA